MPGPNLCLPEKRLQLSYRSQIFHSKVFHSRISHSLISHSLASHKKAQIWTTSSAHLLKLLLKLPAKFLVMLRLPDPIATS